MDNRLDSALQHASPPLRDRIAKRLAKIKNLEDVRTQELFDRDSKRLDARNRAVYKQLGLDMPEKTIDDDETVIADDIVTNHYDGGSRLILPLVLAASLGAGGIGAAVPTMLMLIQNQKPPAQQTVERIRGKLRFYLPDGKEVPTVERQDD